MKENGSIKHLYYNPLAADVELFGAANIESNDEAFYGTDVAFLGRLYQKSSVRDVLERLDERTLAEVESIASLIAADFSKSMFGLPSDNLIKKIGMNLQKDSLNIDERYYVESLIMAPLCNERKRRDILNELSVQFHAALYTDEESLACINDRVDKRGGQDYYSQMPKVFSLSKINLNITSESIESGIPQRIWDILAVGGFCLTDFRPEINEYFDVGKDLVVYHDREELRDLTAFYLAHDDERKKIGMNGYSKVCAIGSMTNRMQTVMYEVLKDMK